MAEFRKCARYRKKATTYLKGLWLCDNCLPLFQEPIRIDEPKYYTLSQPNRYRITNRITNQTYEASAFSADVACRKLGWLIGNCYVREIGIG